MTHGTRARHDFPCAIAAGAGGDRYKLAQDRLLDPADFSSAVALRTAHGCCAWFRASALTVGAYLEARYLNLFLGTENCLPETDSQVITQVVAARWAAPGSTRTCEAAEKFLEDVAKATKPAKAPFIAIDNNITSH